MQRPTVLIIKHGFSETCDHRISPVVSLGDVFRCTCLLEAFPGHHVTWITATAAAELLRGNHLIDRLLLADSPDQLEPAQRPQAADIVINLEKQRDWCLFAAQIPASQRYGFADWTSNGPDAFYPESAAALAQGLNTDRPRPVQHTLFETIGQPWTGQHYSLGHQPRVFPIYDVGLNHHVGPKWPNKRWPDEYWQKLHDHLLERRYAVAWQQSLNSITHYADWLASCRLIVTCDSLGLHLALALKRKVVALFGPTIPEQIYMYGQGIKLAPATDRPCIPCMQARCNYPNPCMQYLTVDMAIEAIDLLLPAPKQPLSIPALAHQETLQLAAGTTS